MHFLTKSLPLRGRWPAKRVGGSIGLNSYVPSTAQGERLFARFGYDGGDFDADMAKMAAAPTPRRGGMRSSL